jgi:hypothetical protein
MAGTTSLPAGAARLRTIIRPLEIQRWMKSLHTYNGLAWTTVAKIRGIMHRVYKVCLLHELVSKNPVALVEPRSKSN